MKIRITEPGLAGYTGDIGGVTFENGVAEVNDVQMNRLAAIMRVRNADDGGPIGPAQTLIDAQHRPAPIVAPLPRGNGTDPSPNVLAAEPIKSTTVYTADELAKIADAKGIAGLRDIGKVYDVKDTAIAGLIDKILKAQAAHIAKTSA